MYSTVRTVPYPVSSQLNRGYGTVAQSTMEIDLRLSEQMGHVVSSLVDSGTVISMTTSSVKFLR